MFSQISKPALTGPAATAFRIDDEPVRSDLTRAFRHLVCAEPASAPILQKALVHLASHPGSLIRARMAWHVGQTCGLSEETSRNLAIGVEYFHTASLVFDDLACMDDASVRRNAVCVHKRFGEATAILAALALVNRAYALIWGETAGLAGGPLGRPCRSLTPMDSRSAALWNPAWGLPEFSVDKAEISISTARMSLRKKSWRLPLEKPSPC